MRKAHSVKMDMTQAFYLAGLFDGQGYFGFYRDKGRRYAQVQLVDKDVELLKPFLVFGGGIYRHSHTGEERHAQSFAYSLRGKRKPIELVLTLYWIMRSSERRARMSEYLKENMALLCKSDLRRLNLEWRLPELLGSDPR